MLAKVNILRGEDNFDTVKKLGKLYQSDNFGASVFNRKDGLPSRFGFVVSTKISKLATQRNRIRRAMGECIRYQVKNLKTGYDVVFLAKLSLAKKTTEEITREVGEFIKNSGLSK